MENTPEVCVKNTDRIGAALAKAQAKFGVIKKTKEGQIGRLTYKYAQLADVVEAIKKPLNDNGIAFTQIIVQDHVNGTTLHYLETVLLHESGQKLTSRYAMPDPSTKDPKEFGKFMTYARRYSISALVGVESEDDTDGTGGAPQKNNNAQPTNNKKRPEPAKTPPKPRNHAPGANPGDFVLTLGKNKGKMLKDVPVVDLIALKKFLDDTKALKPLDRETGLNYLNLGLYISQVEGAQ